MPRLALSDIQAMPHDVDEARLDALTDEDIRRFKAFEGYADARPVKRSRLRVTFHICQPIEIAKLRAPSVSSTHSKQDRR
ncbi:XRE family transcriptional regulator [Methylorubrum populi]|uniref:XRE family transcriptional regulator n=1 Tax=Methylorubrum populi TaxID=223967 RepID=A0A160PIR0_9HYPH|nr:XRE family transcriptional regulator [Methylorubrum populi]